MQKPRIQIKTQTTGATPLTVNSIVVPANKGVCVIVEYSALKSTKDQVAGGRTIANFYRDAGNVSRTAANTAQGLNQSITGNFSSTQPYVDIVANTGTQSIDVQAVGKAGTTIDWIIKYHYILQ